MYVCIYERVQTNKKNRPPPPPPPYCRQSATVCGLTRKQWGEQGISKKKEQLTSKICKKKEDLKKSSKRF